MVGSRVVRRILLATVVPALLAAQPFAPGLPQPELHFKTRLLNTSSTRSGPSSIDETDSPLPSGRGHLVLQFDSPTTPALTAELAARGVRILGDVPENGLLVSLDRRVNLRGLGVRYQGALDAHDKVSPLITSGHPSARRGFYIVEFHSDADMDRARADLVNLGAEVREHPDLIARHLLVRLPPASARSIIARIAALDEAAYIFPASNDLADGTPVTACAGALTANGAVAQLIATQGEGWDGPGLGSAALGYYFQTLTAQLAPSAQQGEFLRAMTEWSKYVKVTWAQAASSTSSRTVNILFATGAHGDGDPFDGKGGTLAHTFYPSPPNSEPLAGDMHFDDAETWRIGANTDLFSVALHELGHALGLQHADDPSAVMYPYYRLVNGLSALDITSIQTLYAPAGGITPPPGLTLSVNPATSPTSASFVTLTGSASGGSGTITVTWSSTTGASGNALGPASGFTIANIVLAPGANTITIRASDSSQSVTTQVTVDRQTTPLIDPLLGSMTHVASGGGVVSSLVLLNTTTAQAHDQVRFFGENGAELTLPLTFPQTGTSTDASLVDQFMAPHAMLLINTASANPSAIVGDAQVTSDLGVSGYTLFRVIGTGQEAVVPLENRLATSYVLPFDNLNGLVTGVAVANLSADPAVVTVVMRDDTGAQVGIGSVSLAGAGHDSFVLTDRFATTANRRGTLEFRTPLGGRISAVGLRFTPSGAFTTIPVLANVTGSGGSLGQYATGGGVKSTIVLVNTGASTAQAHLQFLNDAGAPLSVPLAFPQTGATDFSSTVDRLLSPGAMTVIVSDGLPSPQLVGSARLTAVGAVSGYIIFGTTANGQEAVVPLEERGASSYILPFDNTAGLVTGVATANMSSQAATISVTIRDDTGALIGTSTVALAPNGHTSFVLTDKFAVTADKRGTIEFAAPTGGQISVLGLRFTATGAFTSIPVIAP